MWVPLPPQRVAPGVGLLPGFVMLALLFHFFWFHTVIARINRRMYNMAVDRSSRME